MTENQVSKILANLRKKLQKHLEKEGKKVRRKPAEYTSTVLSSMAKSVPLNSKSKISSDVVNLKVPEVFCFSRNPEEAIAVLLEV